MRVFYLHISFLVSIALFKADQFIEISQHVDEDTALVLSFEEVFKGKLNSVSGFEEINHLADNILEVKVQITFHVC